MSIFSDERVGKRISAVLDTAGVAECDFEEWIRRPPNLTSIRVNAHRISTSKLKEKLEDYLDKVGNSCSFDLRGSLTRSFLIHEIYSTSKSFPS